MKPIQVYNQTTQGLPSWAKGVIAVAVVGGIGFVAYKVYKKFKDIAAQKDAKVVVNENETEYKKLEQSGQKLSFTPNVYSQLVNDIVVKLSGFESFNTELQVIGAIIKVVKKPIDWNYLVAKFGNKDIPDGAWGKTNYDLVTLLKDQLDTSGLYTINEPNFKSTGFAINTINILTEYLTKIGVKI